MSNPPYCSIGDLSVEFLAHAAVVLKLLAHPQRLRIVELLEQNQELPVRDLVEALGLSQPAVSQHLTKMRQVGLVWGARKGKEVWYRIVDDRAVSVLNCIRSKGEASLRNGDSK